MALASQSQSAPDLQRGLLRRPSQNLSSSPIIPVVQAVDFCRSKPRLVELEQQLYFLADGSVNSQAVTESCLSMLHDCDNSKEVFNVFCSCSWLDRYKDPIISQLFYEVVNIQQDSNADVLLLAELEMACEELLKVLTHLGTPNTLQLNVVSLLCNLSRLNSLPPSHLEAVQSYLEEIARALWPYSRPSAPDLWHSEVFCDAQCDVLKACGKFLEDKCPVNTERTFQKINGKLISGDTSQYSRFRLLEIRELRSCGWKLPAATLSYYKSAYQKFRNQLTKDVLISDSRASLKNGFKRMNSFGESKGQSNSKPVTVLRISENELRKSCNNLQELRDEIVKENNVVVDNQSGSSVHSDDLPAQEKVFLISGNEDFGNTSSIKTPLNDVSLSRDTTNLCETDLIAANDKAFTPPSNAMGSNLRCSLEDTANIGGQDGEEKGAATYPVLPVPCSLTEHNVERASSPSSSNGSDDVFTSTIAKDKVVPAMRRGDFKKPRRPFKSDSTIESPVMRETRMSDSSVNNCKVESTAVSQPTELFTLHVNNIKDQLTGETNSVKAAIVSSNTDSNSKVVTEKDCSTTNTSENCRTNKTSSTGSNEIPEGVKEGVAYSLETENWRERPPVDLTEPQNNNFSYISNENWRERKNFSSPDVWTSRSQHENWRAKKSMSVDETARDVNSMSTGQSKRYSTGDIHLEQQDANEKGKRFPGGGFGLPKQARQGIEEASSDEYHETPKSEVVEVQISEEESQGLHYWKLKEIQTDTGCSIFHNRDKCAIVIKGDAQQCKVAKKRVYIVIAALQEDFGTLVPLSDEILEHLQTEGRCMLADRLALCSGANVKMISDTQLFISGHRTCVNLAKAQLAKIKVMLRYTDDPDIGVVTPSQQDSGEGEIQRVDRLFAALEGRPRSLTQTDQSSVDLKPSKGSLTRDFLLSCASSPVAHQRPVDLNLDRTEDWVQAIVLVNGRRGEQVLLEHKKGFGTPNLRPRHPSV